MKAYFKISTLFDHVISTDGVFRLIHRVFVLAILAGLNACSSDETPADIHRKLVPQIARELIDFQHSSRLQGMTLQAENVLKSNAPNGIEFEMGAPQMSSETGIRFYSKERHELFLTIGLDLNATRSGYIVSKISEN